MASAYLKEETLHVSSQRYKYQLLVRIPFASEWMCRTLPSSNCSRCPWASQVAQVELPGDVWMELWSQCSSQPCLCAGVWSRAVLKMSICVQQRPYSWEIKARERNRLFKEECAAQMWCCRWYGLFCKLRVHSCSTSNRNCNIELCSFQKRLQFLSQVKAVWRSCSLLLLCRIPDLHIKFYIEEYLALYSE